MLAGAGVNGWVERRIQGDFGSSVAVNSQGIMWSPGGDAFTVTELLVKPGDSGKAEQSLITVESDKASMEIPSRPCQYARP